MSHSHDDHDDHHEHHKHHEHHEHHGEGGCGCGHGHGEGGHGEGGHGCRCGHGHGHDGEHGHDGGKKEGGHHHGPLIPPADQFIKGHAKDAFLQAMRYRRAIKAFDPAKPLDQADFDFIVEAARLSPSSHGLEPWHLWHIASPDLRAKLVEQAKINPPQGADASHLVVITAKTAQGIDPDGEYLGHVATTVQQQPEDVIAQRRVMFKGFLTDRMGVYGDPAAMFGYTCRQAYIALGNMLTAAAMIGVDSCPIEGMDHAAATAVLAEAGVIDPVYDAVAVAAVFGYRSEDPKRPQTRRPATEVLHTI